MIDNILIYKVKILKSPYPNGEILKTLNYLLENSSCKTVVDILLNSIQPLKVISYKNKPYAVEHLDEIAWLQMKAPDLKIKVYVIEKTSKKTSVEEALFIHYYLKHLSSVNNYDLYAFERLREQAGSVNFLNQKQYCELLNCERTLLYRHLKRFIEPTTVKTPQNEIKQVNFNWSDRTSHIPDSSFKE
ncbi:hypothetical protein [Shewanella gaetbuli]